ncbi:hypothetical protein C8Q74DRAFT_1375418 [Fomes fomentarius]|nr:hypothetical protein C8Q74DRAFT_1375418 [Fomes fomentarius]
MSTHPEAFVLLHIPDVTLATATASESGTLALECVTLAPDSSADKSAPLAASLAESDRSLILVLRLAALELPVDPARAISLLIAANGTRTYTFHADAKEGGGGGAAPADLEPSFIRLTVPPPSRPDAHRAETVEALEHILAQYADFHWQTESGAQGGHAPHPEAATAAPTVAGPPASEDLRGKLVLVDEGTGEVVGELPNRVSIREDPALVQDAKGRDGAPAPVMLELPPDMYDAYTGQGTSVVPYADGVSELDEAREIFVRAIPPEDQDWMTKSATLISSAISTSTSMLLSGFTHATNYYINHSAPAPPPGQTSKDGTPPPPPPRALLLLQHPRTHQTLSRAYAISGQAVKVSQRTVGIVEDIIGKAVGGKSKGTGKGTGSSTPSQSQARPQPYTSASASSVQTARSIPSDAPPPYTGPANPPVAPVDGKPPLPPRRTTQVPLPPIDGLSLAPPSSSQSLSPAAPPSSPSSTSGPGKPLRTHHKLALSANLVLAAVDDSLKRTFDVGAERVTAVVGHKYGPAAARSTHLATHTARNVTLVYIDMRGFARKALIKKAGKQWIKARLGSGTGSGGGREMSGMVVDKQEQGQSQGGQGQKN